MELEIIEQVTTTPKLIEAIRESNVAEVRKLLDEGVNVNAKDFAELDWTALHYAVDVNNVEILTLLLEHGASTDQLSASGDALDLALVFDYIECIKVLLKYGARVYIELVDQMYDVEGGVSQEAIDLVYQHVDVKARCSYDYGVTALHTAVYRKDMRGIEILIKRGANANSRTYNIGWTPLHFAALHFNIPCMIYLMEHGAQPYLKSNDGYSALHMIKVSPRPESEKIQAWASLLKLMEDLELKCDTQIQYDGPYVIGKNFLDVTSE